MLYGLLIYDHTKNKSNVSVTVADSGFLRITEDKKYMVLNLYNGVNYSEEPVNDRERQNVHPFRRDKFDEQTIRVKVNNFEFNMIDENLFKNRYRMLNINQLTVMEDSLSKRYEARLQSYLMQMEINPVITNHIHNRIVKYDSLRQYSYTTADSTFDFESCFNGRDKWLKAEISTIALERARNNSANLSMYEGQMVIEKRGLNQHTMEKHRKFTLSIAVLIFFFIGAPLGAIIRRGGLGMPVVVSILLFIAYYIVSMTGEKSAREDVWQMFTGMWFSTFVFLPVGIWLTYKSANDSTVMSTETYVKLFNKLKFKNWFRKADSESEG